MVTRVTSGSKQGRQLTQAKGSRFVVDERSSFGKPTPSEITQWNIAVEEKRREKRRDKKRRQYQHQLAEKMKR